MVLNLLYSFYKFLNFAIFDFLHESPTFLLFITFLEITFFSIYSSKESHNNDNILKNISNFNYGTSLFIKKKLNSRYREIRYLLLEKFAQILVNESRFCWSILFTKKAIGTTISKNNYTRRLRSIDRKRLVPQLLLL